MAKEHALTWLTCHAKFPRWIQTLFLYLHMNIISASCKSRMPEKWQSMWHTAPHAGIVWRKIILSIAKSVLLCGNWGFPLKLSGTAQYKVSLYTKRYHVSKRGKWIISQLVQFWFCALLSWYVSYIRREWRQGSLSSATAILTSFV